MSDRMDLSKDEKPNEQFPDYVFMDRLATVKRSDSIQGIQPSVPSMSTHELYNCPACKRRAASQMVKLAVAEVSSLHISPSSEEGTATGARTGDNAPKNTSTGYDETTVKRPFEER